MDVIFFAFSCKYCTEFGVYFVLQLAPVFASSCKLLFQGVSRGTTGGEEYTQPFLVLYLRLTIKMKLNLAENISYVLELLDHTHVLWCSSDSKTVDEFGKNNCFW